MRGAPRSSVRSSSTTRSGSGRRAAIEPELVEALLDETTAGRVVLGQRGRGVVRQAGARTPRRGGGEFQLVLHRLWEEEVAAASNAQVETLERLGGAEEVVRRISSARSAS